MSSEKWDVVIVGGGITGAGIARDAAFRGLKVALVEKGDFSGATSSATSKLAHGGLRYLKTLEFGLVRESLRERRRLELIAPHSVYPLPFIVPIYSSKLLLRTGMMLYDLLSYDKGRLADPGKRLPRFQMFSPKETLALEPGIDPVGLKGGALYYDCQNLYPDRVCLEFLRDAVDCGASVANAARVTRFAMDGNQVRGVVISDELNPTQTYEISGRLVVNATGPWANLLFKDGGLKFPGNIRRAKGIHLITRRLTQNHALVLETKGNKRVFFVLPWRGFSIVGTTDVDYPGAPDDVSVTVRDRDQLLTELNETYPSARLTARDVLSSYVGIRPLVEEIGKDSTQVSRKYEIYDHEEESGLENILTVTGGKWTTTRQLAEEVTTLILRKLRQVPIAATTDRPVSVARFGLLSDYMAHELSRWQGKASPALIRTLIQTYGNRYLEVLETSRFSSEESASEDVIRLGEDAYLLGQVDDAVENEMALHLTDFLRRRTGLGLLGDPGRPLLDKLATRMGHLLGWDEAAKNQEIDHFYRSFAINA